MRSARWFLSYVVVASVGLGLAFMLSLRFVAPAHSQTPEPSPSGSPALEKPSEGDLPAEFLKEAGDQAKPDSATPSPTSQPSPAPSPTPQANPTSQANPTPPSVSGTTPVPSQTPSATVPPNPDALVGEGATAPTPPAPPASGSDEYVYDPTGRRDPFKPYRMLLPALEKGDKKTDQVTLEPLQRWDVDRLQVVGVLWDVKSPRAMLKDPDGFVYTVMKNTKVGRNNGFVAAIREGEVVVVQTVENEGTSTKETKILELGK